MGRIRINLDDGWLPSSVGRKDERHVVRLSRFQGNLEKPFLFMDLDSASEQQLLPLEDFLRLELPPARPPLAFVFHMARTGSTLVSEVIRQLDSIEVLSEPGIVNDVFQLPNDVPKEERWKTINQALAWFDAVLGKNHRLVVKLSSWVTLHIGEFLKRYPDTRSAFVYRDPVEVLSAIVESPPNMYRRSQVRDRSTEDGGEYFRECLVENAMLGEVDYDSDTTFSDFCGRVLGVVCKTAAEHSDSLYPLKYEAISDYRLDGFLDYLSIQPNSPERDAIDAVMKRNPKRRDDASEFTSDSDAKNEKATPLVREAALKYVEPHLSRLDRRREALQAKRRNSNTPSDIEGKNEVLA